MIQVSLPGIVELHCPAEECKGEFHVTSTRLNNCIGLFCPFCGKPFTVYDGLGGQLRRKVYHAIRDHLERRVYEQQQIDREGYFEDEANLK
jgi:hypothetical protein